MNISTYESKINSLEAGGGGGGGANVWDIVILSATDYTSYQFEGDYQSISAKLSAGQLITGIVVFMDENIEVGRSIYYLSGCRLVSGDNPYIVAMFFNDREGTTWFIHPDNTVESDD